MYPMPGFKYINVEGKTTEFQRAIKIKRKKKLQKKNQKSEKKPPLNFSILK